MKEIILHADIDTTLNSSTTINISVNIDSAKLNVDNDTVLSANIQSTGKAEID